MESIASAQWALPQSLLLNLFWPDKLFFQKFFQIPLLNCLIASYIIFICCISAMASGGAASSERGIKILPLKRPDEVPKGRPEDWLHANDSKCAL